VQAGAKTITLAQLVAQGGATNAQVAKLMMVYGAQALTTETANHALFHEQFNMRHVWANALINTVNTGLGHQTYLRYGRLNLNATEHAAQLLVDQMIGSAVTGNRLRLETLAAQYLGTVIGTSIANKVSDELKTFTHHNIAHQAANESAFEKTAHEH
jgi:hypothetical protein